MTTTMTEERTGGTDAARRARSGRLDLGVRSATESPAVSDLRGLRPLIVFVDGVGDPGSPEATRSALLCAWAITWDGRRALLSLAQGCKDGTASCRAFFSDLKRRGLADPVLVVTDGESPLLRASEICFPTALTQRCLGHHMRFLGCRLPQGASGLVLHAVRAACEAPSPAAADALRRDVARRHAAAFPSLVAYFDLTLDSCTTHLHLPRSLHRVARTTLVAEWILAARRRLTEEGGDPSRAPFGLEALRDALELVLEEGGGITIGEEERVHLEALEACTARGARRAG